MNLEHEDSKIEEEYHNQESIVKNSDFQHKVRHVRSLSDNFNDDPKKVEELYDKLYENLTTKFKAIKISVNNK